jgi:AbrB family looped-hinge helix DNA binding protein
MVAVQVRERWQVTVPREVRQSLNLQEGGELLFIPLGSGQWQVKALPPRIPLPDLIDRLASPGRSPDLDRLREEMGDDMAREILDREDRR